MEKKLRMQTEDEKEIDRLREENCKLNSDKVKLIDRLNEHVNTISDLNNIIKVAGDEKASSLTVIRLIQSDDINVRWNNNESQVWTRIESKTQGKTKNQTSSQRINQARNQILEPNQYTSLAVDESESEAALVLGPTAGTVPGWMCDIGVEEGYLARGDCTFWPADRLPTRKRVAKPEKLTEGDGYWLFGWGAVLVANHVV